MRLGPCVIALVTAACTEDVPVAPVDAATTDAVDAAVTDAGPDVPRDAGVDVDPALARGTAVFRRYCAHCHGARGAGTGDGPDLRVRVPTVDDPAVMRLLRVGGVRMPAIPIDDGQRSDVLAYLRATFGEYTGP